MRMFDRQLRKCKSSKEKDKRCKPDYSGSSLRGMNCMLNQSNKRSIPGDTISIADLKDKFQ